MISATSGVLSLRRLEHQLGFSRRVLYQLADRAPSLYAPFDLRHPRKSRWRHIDNPQGDLMTLQRAIQRRLFSRIPLPPTMLGGVRGKSIRHNAVQHVGAPTLVKLDLANCFPSISNDRVFDALRRHGFSTDISGLLTKITTHEGALPQGAPTSTMVANLCLLPLHDDLLDLALQMGLWMTIWVDDIAFSGEGAERIIEPAIRIILDHGFRVRSSKKEIMRAGQRHDLTGTCVNRMVSAGRFRIVAIRERIVELSNCPSVLQSDLDQLRGRVANVSAICPLQGRVLAAFAARNLPYVGLPGERHHTYERRRCPGRRAHSDS